MLKFSPSDLVFNLSWSFGSCPRVSLGVLRSRLLFFVGDASPPFDCALSNLSDPPLMLMILVRNSAGTRPELCRNTRHTRLLFGTRQANFAPHPDRSQTLSHDGSSKRGTACTSVRDSAPVAKRLRSTLSSCLCPVQNLLAQVLLILLKIHVLKTNRVQHWCAASLSLCMKKRRKIQIV